MEERETERQTERERERDTTGRLREIEGRKWERGKETARHTRETKR